MRGRQRESSAALTPAFCVCSDCMNGAPLYTPPLILALSFACTRRVASAIHVIRTVRGWSHSGYWLNAALKNDNAACLDGSAPLYYHRPGTGTGANKWYIHHGKAIRPGTSWKEETMVACMYRPTPLTAPQTASQVQHSFSHLAMHIFRHPARPFLCVSFHFCPPGEEGEERKKGKEAASACISPHCAAIPPV